uniref:NADH dehydrogenase subunit 6 n=1 Tax=Salurnis marginella TaxID=1453305 RepID=UPI0030FE82A2
MMKKMMIINTILTPMMKHPMSMGAMLIIQTILSASFMSNFSTTTWYSYILYVTTIGGLMIMFMYMSSIASNEKFKFLNKKTMMIIPLMMAMMTILDKDDTLTNMQNMETIKENFIQTEEIKSTSKFFNTKKMNLTIMMILTLLLTMISVTNISNSFEGPLKKTYV